MQQIRILHRWALAAAAAITVVCLMVLGEVALPTLAWHLWTGGVIDRNLAFDLIYDGVPIELHLAILVSAAAVFLVWLYRARRNVCVSAEASRLLHTAWLGPMWVIPIVSLVVPGLFVARLAEVSTAPPVQSPSRSGLRFLVWTWWVCWAISNSFITGLASVLPLETGINALPPLFSIAVIVLFEAAGVLAIVMMFKITSAQRALFLALLPVPNPTDFPAFTVGEIPTDGASERGAAV